MPVISLPEYLGIQEAPQQPVFQRTRHLAQPRSPWERDVQIADAMTQLRQQQPLSQIQAVQNEYDNIMMNAEKIRREREAASQAERAVSALAGLTPESDDYLKQRRQIMTQFPSAVLDPRVQSIMDDSDRMFNARQSSAARMEQERLAAEAARADEIQKRATSLIEMGVPPDQAMRDAQSPYTSAQAKFQRSQKPESDQAITMRERELKLLESQQKAMDESFVNTEDPKYIQLANEIDQARSDLRSMYRNAYTPRAATAQAAPVAREEARIPFRPQEMDSTPATPKSFKDTMKKGASQAPKAADILKVTDEEVIKDINSPDATEDTFTTAIADPNASEKVKTAALERLRQFAKEPKFPLGTTSREARNRIASLQEKIKEGEKLIRMGPEMEKYREAWTAEKSDIANDIEAYAKSLGLDTDLIAADLAKNEPLTDDPENPFTIRDDFNKFLKGKLDKRATKLEPFAKSEFAKELGERVDLFTSLTPTGLLGQAAQAFGILPNAQKSYGDVLDVYLNEKFGQNPSALANRVAPANGGSSVTGQPKIQIGQPRKVQ